LISSAMILLRTDAYVTQSAYRFLRSLCNKKQTSRVSRDLFTEI